MVLHLTTLTLQAKSLIIGKPLQVKGFADLQTNIDDNTDLLKYRYWDIQFSTVHPL